MSVLLSVVLPMSSSALRRPDRLRCNSQREVRGQRSEKAPQEGVKFYCAHTYTCTYTSRVAVAVAVVVAGTYLLAPSLSFDVETLLLTK